MSNLPQSNQKIISIYPKLQEYDIEWQGNVFNCTNCMGMDNCCGIGSGKNPSNNNNFRACQKCICQMKYDIIDGQTRSTGKIPNLGCDKIMEKTSQKPSSKCTDNIINKDFCNLPAYNYLKNNLNPTSIQNCSVNFVNTGKNTQVSNISLKSQCNNEEAGVDLGNSSKNPSDYNNNNNNNNSIINLPKGKINSVKLEYIYIIIGFIIFLFLIYFIFIRK